MEKEKPDKYAKYKDNFVKAVEEEKAKPVIWDGDLSKVEWTFADDDTGIVQKFLRGEIKIQDNTDASKTTTPLKKKRKKKNKAVKPAGHTLHCRKTNNL
jgi:ABC-type oligopeptide transport system substrate-binding subunit